MNKLFFQKLKLVKTLNVRTKLDKTDNFVINVLNLFVMHVKIFPKKKTSSFLFVAISIAIIV